eukprot:NODE_72_length_2243_cov_320.022852.p1 GENE.NODE_72_length_2243_cov_320.022852~~NODE_72_length_2243_cov_320.022852.p1  ORF type:complete len:504 (-),score=164.79 NODE_72_length_2243_cov_320.022852:681-2192(-)
MTAEGAAVQRVWASADTPGESPVDSTESTFNFDTVFARDHSGRFSDSYVLSDEKCGEGSSGSVYRATCRHTRNVRAVKVMACNAWSNRVRFQQEVELARPHDHPNVVRLYETFRDETNLYLVMELCTGPDLFDYIAGIGGDGFNENKAARCVHQIITALCYLHAHRCAHRDVKPENFLFASCAEDAALKIVDFGLARRFVPRQPMHSKVGTDDYVAPEVLFGSYDERCDVWSAGVISFILLCGHTPFPGVSAEVRERVRVGKFEFASPAWDNVSHGAKNTVTQMLTFDPLLRPHAHDLLTNTWLVYKGTAEPRPISPDFLKQLRSFRAHSRLKRIALTVIAQQLPDSQVEALRCTFQGLDTNGDGMLSAEEVRAGLEQQGLQVPQALDDIIRRADCDGSGSLDYTEFLAAFLDRRTCAQRDVCWSAFRTFDRNGDGKITREELAKVLARGDARNPVSEAKITRMIQDTDANGDGCIDFEEFYSMMKSSPDKRRRLDSAIAAAA